MPVKCQDILPFDIRKFNIKMNQKIVDWIYGVTDTFCEYRNNIWKLEEMEIFLNSRIPKTIGVTLNKVVRAGVKCHY